MLLYFIDLYIEIYLCIEIFILESMLWLIAALQDIGKKKNVVVNHFAKRTCVIILDFCILYIATYRSIF